MSAATFPEGTLVTLHRSGRPSVDGRYWAARRDSVRPEITHGPFVVDLRRSSRCDGGFRRIGPDDVVHPARATWCADPCREGAAT